MPTVEQLLDDMLVKRTKALKRAADMLQSIAGDIEDGYSLSDLRGKYVMAVLAARDDALDALAPPRRPDEEAQRADPASPPDGGQHDTP